MSSNKRMVYIQPENLEFYDSLENKSDFINGALKTARLGGVTDLKTTEVEEGEVVPEGRSADVHSQVNAMRERDAQRLKEYRKKMGLYDPTES